MLFLDIPSWLMVVLSPGVPSASQLSPCPLLRSSMLLLPTPLRKPPGFVNLSLKSLNLKAKSPYSKFQSIISLAHNEQFHTYIKYINIYFHFIYYTIEARKIIIGYCPTEDMVAHTLLWHHTTSLLSHVGHNHSHPKTVYKDSALYSDTSSVLPILCMLLVTSVNLLTVRKPIIL